MPLLPEEFEILTRLGEGTFSTVYKARYRNRPSKLVALKRIYVVSGPSRLNNEVTFLKQVGCVWAVRVRAQPPTYRRTNECRSAFGVLLFRGVHNVVKLVDGIRYNDHVVLVLDYFENDDIKVCLQPISVGHALACR